MTIDEFRAQQYQPDDVLAIRALHNGRRRAVSVRVSVVADEGKSAGVMGVSCDGRVWIVDAQYIFGRVICNEPAARAVALSIGGSS